MASTIWRCFVSTNASLLCDAFPKWECMANWPRRWNMFKFIFSQLKNALYIFFLSFPPVIWLRVLNLVHFFLVHLRTPFIYMHQTMLFPSDAYLVFFSGDSFLFIAQTTKYNIFLNFLFLKKCIYLCCYFLFLFFVLQVTFVLVMALCVPMWQCSSIWEFESILVRCNFEIMYILSWTVGDRVTVTHDIEICFMNLGVACLWTCERE